MPENSLPFALPERPSVTRIRQRDKAELRSAKKVRTQPMHGFDAHYADIVDYIVGITEEIWTDRSIGRIYDTYDEACTVYTSTGIVRSVEEVVASTAQTIYAQPESDLQHLNVAWDGDESDFYTSHLGFSMSKNVGPTIYGPATGKTYGIHFVADCVSRENRIHTEWLARDNASLLRQLGFDAHSTAQRLAESGPRDLQVVGSPAREQSVRERWDGPSDTFDSYWASHFGRIWNRRELDRMGAVYAPDAVVHWPDGRVARGPRAIQDLLVGLLASLPDCLVRVEHKCWSDETDGIIVAVRWQLVGTTAPYGVLGPVPSGKPVSLIGMSHFRFEGSLIVEEWTVFDQFAALVQAYRA